MAKPYDHALIGGGIFADFHIIKGARSIPVCNAPSPTVAVSIEIGRHIAAHAPLPGTEAHHEE
ncbi:hypothetical protein QU481_19040 [Crenobacter sp. SG2303]|uniref:Glucose-methanol-choline oxidoreductase C-terminal domain-containing protein n=1 Tax=Crenobacter oryzisoli TaxID=3056844 RepID=A0ABT7XTS1_9NEIS|nr:hypothetical protein [Crenobacter sp. SG2303]MDN0076944.1 hypothetical protein [Crenobacter sp. SG2303]